MIRAVSYARYSSDLQSDRSVEDQFFDCRKKADQEGLKIVAQYEDRAKSGSSLQGRPGITTLLQAAKDQKFDVLIVESLDRISRSLADTASIYEKLKFWGVRILTVNEGHTNQISVGLRGLINEMFLRDLGKKVRRGQAGNIRVGKHAGGSAYGYRPILGKPGELQIYEPEACIVRRIFAEYVSGMRPRQIIERLNIERIRPPRGQYWQPGALTGSNNRHSGILGNEIYSGELVWNKVRMLKNPETGKRISRPNPESEWHRSTVPSLRIVSDDMFKKATSIRKGRSALAPVLRRKPKRILSGLLRCVACGGGMSIKGRDRGGTRIICTRFHNAGLCENNRTYYLHHIEDLVLSGLRKHLVDHKAIQHFLHIYQEERKRLLQAANALRPSLERQLSEAMRRIARLTDAMIASDAPVGQFTSKIAELERDKLALEARLDDLATPVKNVALHPAVVERYLALVNNLATALREGEPADEMTDAIRDLIDSVVVDRTEPGEPYKLRVNGRITALVGEPLFPESSLSGVKMVARERYVRAPTQAEPLFSKTYRAA